MACWFFDAMGLPCIGHRVDIIGNGVDGIVVFFFQAEDGIRDLVRSRGLGDVYKRQVHDTLGKRPRPKNTPDSCGRVASPPRHRGNTCAQGKAVSYTHLTLPTSDLV